MEAEFNMNLKGQSTKAYAVDVTLTNLSTFEDFEKAREYLHSAWKAVNGEAYGKNNDVPVEPSIDVLKQFYEKNTQAPDCLTVDKVVANMDALRSRNNKLALDILNEIVGILKYFKLSNNPLLPESFKVILPRSAFTQLNRCEQITVCSDGYISYIGNRYLISEVDGWTSKGISTLVDVYVHWYDEICTKSGEHILTYHESSE